MDLQTVDILYDALGKDNPIYYAIQVDCPAVLDYLSSKVVLQWPRVIQYTVKCRSVKCFAYCVKHMKAGDVNFILNNKPDMLSELDDDSKNILLKNTEYNNRIHKKLRDIFGIQPIDYCIRQVKLYSKYDDPQLAAIKARDFDALSKMKIDTIKYADYLDDELLEAIKN